MIVEVLLAADEPLAVDGRQEEAAPLLVAEELDGEEDEAPRFLQPAQLTRRDVELVQTIRHVGVVLEDTGVLCLARPPRRSEEHTSELQSRPHLVCRLLLE